MTDTFDPYHQWLDIPPDQQPPHHYRLLGLPIFEADAAKIRAESDRRMQHVRTFQLGKRSQASQKILNELAAARVTLLNPASKARYDAALADWLAARLPVPPPVLPVDGPPAPPTWELEPWSPPDKVAAARGAGVLRGPRPQRSRVGWYQIAGVVAVVAAICGLIMLASQRPSKGVLSNVGGHHSPPVPLPESHETAQTKLGGQSVIVPENVVIQADDGDVHLGLDRATLGGPTLHLQEDATTGWHSPSDHLEWEFLVQKPGIFQINVTYAADAASAEGQARFELTGQPRPLMMTVRDTGGRDHFVTDPLSKMVMIQRGGRYKLRISSAEQPGDELMTLKNVELHRQPVR